MTRQAIISMLESLDAHAAAALMPRLGYRKREELVGRGVIFENAEGDSLAVPTEKRFKDFGRATLELLESLVSPYTTLDDLVAMLVLPDCDIYRHRFNDDFARWGSFPLDSLSEALPALIDLLGYTAAGVYSQRRNYTRLPGPAQAFERQCRAGQTEQGSYVVKVFCPTNPTSEQYVEEDEPFGRLVTRACVENLAFLGEESADAYEADLPVTLNRNVAAAIARLRPMSFHPDGSASFWFSAAYTQSTDSSIVSIDQRTFVRATNIERRLAQQTGTERMPLKGYIVDLHKDRPQKRSVISHKITMQVQLAAGWRSLSTTLLPSQYRDAVRWHDRNQKVRIDALVDQRTKPWRALEIYEFVSLDAAQIEMFDEGESPPDTADEGGAT